MRDHRRIGGALRHLDGLQRLREGADLVELDQDRVGDALLDPLGEAFGVGHEEIIADELNAVSDLARQRRPAHPVILGHAVLDRDDRVAGGQVGEIARHAFGIEGLTLAGKHVLAVPVELGRRRIEGEKHVIAGPIAGVLDRLGDEAERRVGRGEIWRKAALVADIGVVPGILQLLAQRVEDLRADADGLRDSLGADRHDHEFLDVDRIIRVDAAIDDVHHRHRQGAREDAADIAVKRLREFRCRRLGASKADAERGIGTEPSLVRRAVEVDEQPVDGDLLFDIEAGERIENLAIDRIDCLQDALAAVTGLVAVTQLDRLMRAGGRAGWYRGTAFRPALQRHVDLDGRIAAAVEDFPGGDVDDRSHGVILL